LTIFVNCFSEAIMENGDSQVLLLQCIDRIGDLMTATDCLRKPPIDRSLWEVLRFFPVPPVSQAEMRMHHRADPLGVIPEVRRSALQRLFSSTGDADAAATLVFTVASMMRNQILMTAKRVNHGRRVEDAYETSLRNQGLGEGADVTDRPCYCKHVLVRTEESGTKHEVDFVVYPPDTDLVLFVECKYSGTRTNGKKRCDDIAKKATAWKNAFPKQVETGMLRLHAVLDGEFPPKHVAKLENDFMVRVTFLNDLSTPPQKVHKESYRAPQQMAQA
tara:strand:+ start:297 stop:1121 length:825 start_codon:yes stop_codon:yes gene_type:complete